MPTVWINLKTVLSERSQTACLFKCISTAGKTKFQRHKPGMWTLWKGTQGNFCDGKYCIVVNRVVITWCPHSLNLHLKCCPFYCVQFTPQPKFSGEKVKARKLALGAGRTLSRHDACCKLCGDGMWCQNDGRDGGDCGPRERREQSLSKPVLLLGRRWFVLCFEDRSC